jgi:hypothetical protein
MLPPPIYTASSFISPTPPTPALLALLALLTLLTLLNLLTLSTRLTLLTLLTLLLLLTLLRRPSTRASSSTTHSPSVRTAHSRAHVAPPTLTLPSPAPLQSYKRLRATDAALLTG